MSHTELMELWQMLSNAQPRARAMAQAATSLDDYDAPCRLAAALKEAMNAIEELGERQGY